MFGVLSLRWSTGCPDVYVTNMIHLAFLLYFPAKSFLLPRKTAPMMFACVSESFMTPWLGRQYAPSAEMNWKCKGTLDLTPYPESGSIWWEPEWSGRQWKHILCEARTLLVWLQGTFWGWSGELEAKKLHVSSLHKEHIQYINHKCDSLLVWLVGWLFDWLIDTCSLHTMKLNLSIITSVCCREQYINHINT